DGKLIDKARTLAKEYKRDFEFQLLKGIRDDIKPSLVQEGYRVSEYIPYGPEWYNYSKRRMRERKRNILLLLRSITGKAELIVRSRAYLQFPTAPLNNRKSSFRKTEKCFLWIRQTRTSSLIY